MSERLRAIASQIADHRMWRLVFLSTLFLLPIALVAVIAEAGWIAVVALALSAMVDGLLRWSRLSSGRLLTELRDRSSQFTTLRAGLVAVALLTIADMPDVAAVLATGLVVSVLARVVAGWTYAYAHRASERVEQGVLTGDDRTPPLPDVSPGIRYARWLTASELASVAALGVALGGGTQSLIATVVGVAWALPALWLVGSAGHSMLRPRTHAPKVDVTGRIAVYFAEPTNRAYQLQQWLPVLNDLHASHGVILIFRDRRCFGHFGELTTLPRIYAHTIDDLTDVYDAGDHGVILYVNNGTRNFQSLAWPNAVHVHINHGESDKTSLVTHQSRAYDHVLVAGEAAVKRMEAGLLEVDRARVVVVGRPQLDYVDVGAESRRDSKPVLVYAPTWEGENDANNFSSVDVGGVEIIESLLAIHGVTVLYKPHPRTPISPSPRIRAAHRSIREKLEAAAAKDPGSGHGEWTDDILPLLARADVLVADVSSVAVDHLYLRPDAHLVLMDRGRDGGQVRAADIPIAACATVVRADRLSGLSKDMANLLSTSGQTHLRMSVRQEYFGGLAVGESTRRFQALVSGLVQQRDELMNRDEAPAPSGGGDRQDGSHRQPTGAREMLS
jgi:hypothetical protein